MWINLTYQGCGDTIPQLSASPRIIFMNNKEMVHPITEADRGELHTREELIERWKNARYDDVIRYPSGTSVDANGLPFAYQSGARLIILGEEVMDDCQTPWATATVDRAFDALRVSRRNQEIKDVRVLERGFGMGLVATRVMQHLRITGGNYTAIELNEQVANHADGEWTRRQRRMETTAARSPIGAEDNVANRVGINILRGEAFYKTRELAAQGKKFDIIISDTYPLSTEEKSVNDLLDIDVLLECLAPDGVFAFFGYHTGSDGTLNAKQRSLIERHFENINITYVSVSPSPDYKYFNPPSGAVRRLPVIICTQPIFDVFNPS